MSRILERSAAHFAGVMKGDVLLQVDDKVVLDKDDIARFFLYCFPNGHTDTECDTLKDTLSVCPCPHSLCVSEPLFPQIQIVQNVHLPLHERLTMQIYMSISKNILIS